MTKIDQDERHEFERWLQMEQRLIGRWDNDREFYEAFDIHLAYQAWKSSRAQYAAISAKQTWINIDHALPEKKERCLTFHQNFWRREINPINIRTFNANKFTQANTLVTHWMPMPDQPLLPLKD